MTKDWLTHPWLEKFLPDHLRPVDDHIFSDAHGLDLVHDTEAALDRLIQHGKQVKTAQTFKKNGKTFHFRLKINQKRMKLLSYETPKSEAAIKKRIIIEYIRKAHLPKSRQNRFKEATVQYIKNGQTFVRSIQKSNFFQGIFYKCELLDEVLLGGLMEKSTSNHQTAHSFSSAPKEDKEFIQSSEEPFSFIKELESFLEPQYKILGNLLENRLKRLIEEIERTGKIYELLEIEEKYTIKRLLQKDIPSLIKTYLSLSSDYKNARTEQLYETLTKMEINIRAMREKAEYTKVEKMEQLLKLYEKRYPAAKNKNMFD
ncbi:hypothetical protein ACE1TI_05840 [Alteribacillus sp. JSM 102045]|uniref:hypothetical protein n=1 Tax=Alteribacillus sp. JSM 102045 TaxID=1562101 RepID=UPI0035C09B4C